MNLHMEQFGLKPGEDSDATLPVLLALEACRELTEVTLSFPPGTYSFRPDNMVERQLYITNHDQGGTRRIAFPLQGHRRLTIDGAGSEFRFEGPMIPFVLDQTHGVTLRDFTIDWDRPMYEQGTVIESDEASFVVQLQADVPYSVADGRVRFWFGGRLEPVWGLHDIDPESKAHVYQSGDRISWGAFAELWVEEAGEGRIRICGGPRHRPKVGSLIAMRFGRRENPGIFVTGGSDVRVERVTVHHAPGMGLVAQRCTDIRLHMFRVALRPSSERIVTATADAAHFTNCRGRITLEHCLFENQLDDPLNVHGIYTRVAERLSDDTLLVRLMHEMTIGVEVAVPGDVMQVVDSETLLGKASATVREAVALSARETLLRFAEPLPASVQPGDSVENRTWNADLTVRYCTVRANRARGLLITTPGKVLVEFCRISAPGAGIKLSGDARSWYESGAVEDVTIRRNTFGACNYCHPDWGQAVIDIDPEIEPQHRRDGYYHRRIVIEDNRFDTFGGAIVYGHSVDGFVFRYNRIRRSAAYPWHEDTARPLLELTDIGDAEIGGNECPADRPYGRVRGELVSLE
ncbi:right-handed parallel beta-helix repeat-containing protein [Paenibacillus sp. HJGM_3]|uniref:right-handed parallel beta-helix repeat-containing protein n=1 Tax=Paenibacillus sp. HJGM_3 TaxID=3379816 RepID=UPI00385839C9